MLEDFHLIDQFGAILLKYVEEPPASTFFVILAEDVPPELVTIASPLGAHRPRTRAAGGRHRAPDRRGHRPRPGRRRRGGRRRRPRPGAAARHRRAVRGARGGAAGHAGSARTARARGRPSWPPRSRPSSTTPRTSIDARHEQEAAELEERIERYGQRGSGKKDIEDRHKREVRRHRTAELRLALATFAGVYRDALPSSPPPRRGGRRPSTASTRSRSSSRCFPNEALMLQSLLAQLPASTAGARAVTPRS